MHKGLHDNHRNCSYLGNIYGSKVTGNIKSKSGFYASFLRDCSLCIDRNSELQVIAASAGPAFRSTGFLGKRKGLWKKKEQQERRTGCIPPAGGEKDWSKEGTTDREKKMAVIRIKSAGFGQSRAWVGTPVPGPHPHTHYSFPVPSSSPNQLLWHMRGASMTHKPHREHPRHTQSEEKSFFICFIC